MQYSIEGRNCELLRVELHDTEGVLAEVGKLIFMRGAVTWNVVLPGRGVAGKIVAGIKRKIGGASVVLTEYAGPGEVGFSGDGPGTIRAVELSAGEEVIVRRGGFLAASPSVTLSVALVTRLRAGLLAGHTLILQRVTGEAGALRVRVTGRGVDLDLTWAAPVRPDRRRAVRPRGVRQGAVTTAPQHEARTHAVVYLLFEPVVVSGSAE